MVIGSKKNAVKQALCPVGQGLWLDSPRHSRKLNEDVVHRPRAVEKMLTMSIERHLTLRQPGVFQHG
jgi:hypothetical protein